MSAPRILVVGAGFSGSLTALHLLMSPGGVRVVLAERGAAFGPGLAYGLAGSDHLLNVRAANMSAFPDQPSHFIDWLGDRGEADAFVHRSLYGAYVQQQLRAAATGAGAAGRLDLVGDGVSDLQPVEGGRLLATFSMGRSETFDAVVLAIGNPPPSQPRHDVLADAHPRYVADPWAPGAFAGVGADDRVLLLGTGLTMIDVAEVLSGEGPGASILALSRRGLTPHPHARSRSQPSPPDVFDGPLSRRLDRLRHAVDDAAGDWRSTFDSLRPFVEDLWLGLSTAERRRFLRHLRPYWEIHRHRQAPATAKRTRAYLADGRLSVRAGKLVAVTAAGSDRLHATWRPRGERRLEAVTVDWLVNCTGSEGELAGIRDPLIQNLLARGLVQQDDLGLGLDVTHDGAVVSSAGEASARLTAVGPLTRGVFWECTAVPDIRTKAAALAAWIGRALA